MTRLVVPLAFIFGIYLPFCTGLCEFPSDLRGSWFSADKGSLNFTESLLVEYPVFLSNNVSNMTFTCEEINTERYILRGINTFTVFGNDLRPYLCITLTQVSVDTFYYYVINRLESSNSDRIFVREDSFAVTADEICNRETPYELGTYIMLIREGVTLSSISRTCPNLLLRTVQNMTLQSDDGSMTCDGVRADVCTNTSVLTIDYQSCDPTLLFSDGGEFVCLFDLTDDDGTTYVALWNTDDTLTDGETYRTSCYALQETDDVTHGTEYPNRCHHNQTSSFAPPGGVYIAFRNVTAPVCCNCTLGMPVDNNPLLTLCLEPRQKNCVPTVSTTPSSTESLVLASIIGGVTGSVVLVLAIALFLIGCFCKKSKSTVIVVKEAEKVNHPARDTDTIVDVEGLEDETDLNNHREQTNLSSDQMSSYSSPYLAKTSIKTKKTSPKILTPSFDRPLYGEKTKPYQRDFADPFGTEKHQSARLVKNGLYGMDKETDISYPVKHTSLPDIHGEAYDIEKIGKLGGTLSPKFGDSDFAFQNLAMSATDNYKLLVKSMTRGEKQLSPGSSPSDGGGQYIPVYSSPQHRRRNNRQNFGSPNSSPESRVRRKESNGVYSQSKYNGSPPGRDKSTNKIARSEYVHDYSNKSAYNDKQSSPSKASVQTTPSFGSSSKHSQSSQSNEKGKRLNSPCNSDVTSGGSSRQYSGNNDRYNKVLVDTCTNTDDINNGKGQEGNNRVITPKVVHKGVSVGIQTDVESHSKLESNFPGIGESNHSNYEPWQHPLVNYEHYGSSNVKKSSSVPAVLSGYEMAQYNPPNIVSSSKQDRLAKRLGLTTKDMVWCIEPRAHAPRRNATYNLGSMMTNNNNSRRLGRFKSQNRIVTPWK